MLIFCVILIFLAGKSQSSTFFILQLKVIFLDTLFFADFILLSSPFEKPKLLIVTRDISVGVLVSPKLENIHS